MKKLFMVTMFLLGLNALIIAQAKTIDLIDTDANELSDIRAKVYTKYSIGKMKGNAITKDDIDLLTRISQAIIDKPNPSIKVNFNKVPVEYTYNDLKESFQKLNMYFEQRKEFMRFKRILKMYYAQDTTIVTQLQNDLMIGKQRFKLIVADKEDN